MYLSHKKISKIALKTLEAIFLVFLEYEHERIKRDNSTFGNLSLIFYKDLNRTEAGYYTFMKYKCPPTDKTLKIIRYYLEYYVFLLT